MNYCNATIIAPVRGRRPQGRRLFSSLNQIEKTSLPTMFLALNIMNCNIQYVK